MPIRPERKGLYPKDWKAISRRIRFERAGGRCECTGQCGTNHPWERCASWHGEPLKPDEASPVVLTTAHLNHDETDCRDDNLLAMCQACHLRYDAKHHAQTAKQTRERKSGQMKLIGIGEVK